MGRFTQLGFILERGTLQLKRHGKINANNWNRGGEWHIILCRSLRHCWKLSIWGHFLQDRLIKPSLVRYQFAVIQVVYFREILLHVLYITVTDTKQLVIDGLSRGDFLEGVMAWYEPLRMLPLKKVLIEILLLLEIWIKIWWGNKPLTVLIPRGVIQINTRVGGYPWW